MDSGGNAARNQAANEIAVPTFGRKVDRWRRALLPLADVAQVERLAKPAPGLADQQDFLASGFEGDRRRFGEIIEHADAADGRRRQDRAAIGLVVERDVAG